MKFMYASGLLFGLVVFGHVHAQEDTGAVPSIEVKGERYRLVSYKESYEIAKKVRVAGNGRVALGLRLVPSTADVRVDDIRLWLEAGTRSEPVTILPGAIFVVPVDDEIAQQGGNFSINKKKGQLTARILILPALGRDSWTVKNVRLSIQDAKSAIDKFTPWYQKPFAPKVHSVSVCTREAGVPVQVMQGETVVATLPTSEKATNDAAQPVFCQHFDADTAYAEGDRIAIPASAEVLFL